MKVKEPTPEERRILHHLITVWGQYNSWGSSYEDGVFGHACMQAGERACELLEEYGLAFDDGWNAVLTEKGKQLRDYESI